MPRVSVVVPAFNAQRYLQATLESALAQTERDYEVVVVNDGSTDQTGDIAEAFGRPVRVLHQSNAEVSASRNRGINSSDSEFIALLDSDDIWHPQKLELQLQALTARPEAAFCYTGFTWWHGEPYGDWVRTAYSAQLDEALSGWIYHRLILDNHALPSSLLFRRSAWEELGPFVCEHQQTDDWEYIVRASHSFPYLRVAAPLVLYRQVPTSLSKRLPANNLTENMRESLIARFGLESPNGTPVDLEALKLQRYKGWRNFADAHCARGDLALGLRTFGRLLRDGPRRAHSALSLLMSCRRRLFPQS